MFATILRAARLPFLTLTPSCVFAAWALARADGSAPEGWLVAVVALAALAAHVSVNLLNEYSDFVSGIDLQTRRTPFSGGSGALPEYPAAAPAVRVVGIAMLGVASAVGLYLVALRGWPLLLIGLTGAALVTLYSGPVNRRPLLCLVAPGLGFGVCMLLGAEVALGGAVNSASIVVTAITGLVVSNLLLLNQLPDIAADREGGRRHLPIVHGTAIAARAYAALAALAFLVLLAALASGVLPRGCALALIMSPAAVAAARGALLHGAQLGNHPHFLALNAAVANLTPLLLGIGLLTGA